MNIESQKCDKGRFIIDFLQFLNIRIEYIFISIPNKQYFSLRLIIELQKYKIQYCGNQLL